MASEMDDGSRLYVLQHVWTIGRADNLGRRRHVLLDDLRFFFDHGERYVLEGVADGNKECICLQLANRLDCLLGMKKRANRRGVRRNEIVGATLSVISSIDASRVERQAHEYACRTEGQSRTVPSHRLLQQVSDNSF
jgi:hypothetical protein